MKPSRNSKPQTAADILSALARRHHEDIFVSECKDGPTHTNDHLRLDAWAMNRSWKHLTFTGYEVKVSRSDFLRDQKLMLYLPLCHMLYLVTPPKLVAPEEVPAEVGLMWTSVNGGRLHIRKQAQRRAIEMPANLLLYVLMARARIKDETSAISSSAYWREWQAERKLDHDLGCRVSKAIREEIERRVKDAESENERLSAELDNFKDIRNLLADLGCPPNDLWRGRRMVRDIVGADLEGKLRLDTTRAIETLQRVLAAIPEDAYQGRILE